MERSAWLRAVVVACCLFAVSPAKAVIAKDENHHPVYNHTLAKILVQYDAAYTIDNNERESLRSRVLASLLEDEVYESDLTALLHWTCSRCNGPTEGFEVIELIVDIQHCLQSYVGVAKDLNAVIIAFRGTQENSLQNWVEDLYWKQLDLNYPGMPDAMVHHGFYYAYHNTTLRPGVISAVKRAKELYGDLDIIVLGHSMGGAMAAFCALDLKVHHQAKNVQVVTFGQPRVGNSVFASYYSQLVPNTIRVVHDHDIVPHLPPYYTFFPRKTYHHFPREVWLYDIDFGSLIYAVEKVCDGSGEDSSCSRSVMGSSITDHLIYFGINLQADTWNSCKIVRDPGLAKYATTDHAGNIILRKPASSVLKMKTQSDTSADID